MARPLLRRTSQHAAGFDAGFPGALGHSFQLGEPYFVDILKWLVARPASLNEEPDEPPFVARLPRSAEPADPTQFPASRRALRHGAVLVRPPSPARAGTGFDGRHFFATIVSAEFEGASRVQRHQRVYRALGDRMREQIHALSMKTLTPEEWSAR